MADDVGTSNSGEAWCKRAQAKPSHPRPRPRPPSQIQTPLSDASQFGKPVGEVCSVDPGEKLSLIRVITSVSEVADYGQTYGVTSDSMIGTEGKIWDGHYYWGLNINHFLDSPSGTMNIQGSSRITTYTFKIVRESSKGRTETPLPVDLAAAAVDAAEVPAAVLAKFVNIGKLALADDTVQISVPGISGQEPAPSENCLRSVHPKADHCTE
ncbi:hypothetical protein DFH06DRAFT_1137478 [Mycena polygramma]|nr:hypothetical protein DFH06DRAFT_1137478 [Mycena polygramma]